MNTVFWSVSGQASSEAGRGDKDELDQGLHVDERRLDLDSTTL